MIIIIGLFAYILRMRVRLHTEDEKLLNTAAEQLFDVWPVSVIIIDIKGRINRVNNQLIEKLQLDRADLLGKDITSVLEVICDKENRLPHFFAGDTRRQGTGHITLCQ
ncbi:MAG: PAS domain-containing protein [Bacteroides sp.]|nr:PAS domain-containing protein [Bacteroides sp.]